MSTKEIRDMAEDMMMEYGAGYTYEDVCSFFPGLDEFEAEEVWEMGGSATIEVKWND